MEKVSGKRIFPPLARNSNSCCLPGRRKLGLLLPHPKLPHCGTGNAPGGRISINSCFRVGCCPSPTSRIAGQALPLSGRGQTTARLEKVERIVFAVALNCPTPSSRIAGQALPLVGGSLTFEFTGGICIPAGGSCVPAGENCVPAGEIFIPAGGSCIPVGGIFIPAGENRIPAGGSCVPAGGIFIPAGGSWVPAGGIFIPAGGNRIPAGGSCIPAGGSCVPVGGIFIPAGGSCVPAGGSWVPAGGSCVPAGIWEIPPHCPCHRFCCHGFFNCVVTPSRRHAVTPSRRHLVTPSPRHDTTLPLPQIPIKSFPHWHFDGICILIFALCTLNSLNSP